ncbi:MAG: polysaccharide biosynthesis protein [Butyrivibrio sp.]|uniref:PssD/Cps14F family polysaccharide biosynthesis glycosyltransferase n=1 Tax=Butyrivibrio sp. TaxID=28121 RepID=UPI0025C0F4E2|nr:PssD/Cps14F family polysaccharide biosynthesis glycosyltransferase [Butyrivibrio sp.]MBQ6587548.1 polysaccharide biosynthesis protein [Butyrivibrio sp.]
MDKEGTKKICFVASSGGHLEEISRLKGIEGAYDCFLVTEKSDFVIKDFCEKKYYVPMMNRRQINFLPKFIWLFFRTLVILLRENPDFIITTGALVAYPFCVVGKFLGIKVIYVESFARVNEPSLTGKLVYNMSDLFMVQWEDMLQKYPKSMLGGGIF